MSEEEENNAQQPKRVALTADAKLWYRKWSTWLALVGLMFDAAALTFAAAPGEWKVGFPAWLGLALLGVGMTCKALIPVATSLSQKSLQQ